MNRHHYITRHDILGKSMESNNRGGIRTRNFRIRSPTPYPLGHTIIWSKITLIYWLTIQKNQILR